MKTNFNKWMKIVLLSLVLFRFFPVQAGSYDDFFTAVRNDRVPKVRELIQRGFDPNTQDDKRRTGLILAVTEDSLRVAGLLVDVLNIDLEAQNPAGENALMLASLRGHEALVRHLIERGAEVNKPGWAPIHYAATGGHTHIVRLLLEHHAFVDSESPNGTTPLMLAAQYGHVSSVKLLLEEGAEVTQKNKLGLTALDFALRGARPDAEDVLRKALAEK